MKLFHVEMDVATRIFGPTKEEFEEILRTVCDQHGVGVVITITDKEFKDNDDLWGSRQLMNSVGL